MKFKIGTIIKNKKMKYQNQNVGILYFSNPSSEAESVGKIVDGVMRQVGRDIPVRKVNSDYEVTIVEKAKPTKVPSIIFTDNSGDLEHLRIEGSSLSTITVEGVLNIVQDIIKYNSKNNG
jgi:hypothetical protein|tara:strand:- start:1414 stop:1773 length:360 start_codon:yes stop_codon:yes gene_type:complete